MNMAETMAVVGPPMRLGFVGILIAGTAVAISVVAGKSLTPGGLWAYVVWGMCALGVGLGFIAIPWGWWRIVKFESKPKR